MEPTTNPLLLSYAVSSTPQPLLAGQTGSVSLGVSPITPPAYCDTITLVVKVGGDPDCPFTAAPSATASPASWAHEPARLVDGSSIGLGDGTYASVKFYTTDPSAYDIDYPLVLGLEGEMNATPGTFTLYIDEHAGTTSDPSSFTQNSGTQKVTSETASFFVGSFIANATGAPTLPCTEFANGAAITLQWESNGTSYQLFRKGEGAPFWSGTQLSYTVSAGIATDTTFVLVATMTAAAAGDPVEIPAVTTVLYDALTLTVSNPDLTPRTVVVARTLEVDGAATLQGGMTVGAGATVNGGGTINGGAIITGGTTIGGGTTINDGTTINNGATINGGATITGDATIGGRVTINGDAAAAGALSVAGHTTLGGGGTINGGATATGPLTVTGPATFNGRAQASTAALSITGAAYLSSAMSPYALQVHSPGDGQFANAYFFTGDTMALWAINKSDNATILAMNNGSGPTSVALYGQVGHSERWGLFTDGRIGSTGGTAHFTQVETRRGPRAATSPLSLRVEVQASGSAWLRGGRAFVAFEDAFADLILPGGDYRVLATPLGRCGGLHLAAREDHGFMVESGDADADVEFHWMVVAEKRSGLDSAERHDMPAEFPRVAMASGGDAPFPPAGEPGPGAAAGFGPAPAGEPGAGAAAGYGPTAATGRAGRPASFGAALDGLLAFLFGFFKKIIGDDLAAPRADPETAMEPTTNPLRLSYAVSSTPQPLLAGRTGSVSLGVSPITPPAYCDTITLVVKVGGDPDCPFTAAPSATVSPASWAHDPARLVDGRELGLDDGTYASVKFYTTEPSAYDIDYPLVLGLEGDMNATPGTFTLYIDEHAGKTSDPSSFTQNSGTRSVTSETATFFVGSFIANATGAPTVPCTEFANGAPITLQWESNATSYQLFRKGEGAPFWSGTQTSYTVTGGIATDTTFVLVATMTAAGDPVEIPAVTTVLYDALTLTVSNPDLTPRTVAVAQTLEVDGAATLKGGATVSGGGTINGGAQVNGDLTATGRTTLQTTEIFQALGVNGDMGVAGMLEVVGLATFGGGAQVNGDLAATGHTTLQTTRINQQLGVNGELGVNGDVIVGGELSADGELSVVGESSFFGAVTVADPQVLRVGYLDDAGGQYGIQAQSPKGFAMMASAGVAENLSVGGSIYNGGWAVTRLATRDSHLPATPPLSLRHEIHLSGSARLSGGRAAITFDDAVRDVIAGAGGYRVLLTAGGDCRGLCATERDAAGFAVVEMQGGSADVEFDWFVVAPRANAPGAAEARELADFEPFSGVALPPDARALLTGGV